MDTPEQAMPVIDSQGDVQPVLESKLAGPSKEDLAALEKSRLEQIGRGVKNEAAKRAMFGLANLLFIPLSLFDDGAALAQSFLPGSDIAKIVETAGFDDTTTAGSYNQSNSERSTENEFDRAKSRAGQREVGNTPPHDSAIQEVNRLFQKMSQPIR